MKNSFALGVAALAGAANAFPAMMYEAVASSPVARTNVKAKRLNGISPGFDATAQYISTSGEYEWVAPGPTDQRGPCPGLNAFANHGYIPHNGIATIQQFIDATTKVVGMGADLAAFLSIYGAVFDGDLTSWSIGGPDARVGIPLLGEPEGISGSHNKYEADVSPTRGDLYEYGNDYKLVVKQFKEEFQEQADETDATSNYDIGVLTTFRAKRFQESIDNNPYFLNNFFSGLLVQPAAYTFQYRFMANHSEADPAGRLSKSVLKTWFSITGKYPNFKYTPGHERIPDNWYRRAFGDEYTIPFFLEDVVGMAVEYPQFLDVGGNTGTVNTFTGVDIGNLTGGIYDANTLLNPDKLACFEYQILTQQAPDILEPYFYSVDGLLAKALSTLAGGLNPLVVNITCPTLNTIQQSQFQQAFAPYPGSTDLKSDGTY